VNDRNPIFKQQIYEYNVTENTDGYLTRVEAMDSDGTPLNYQVIYSGIDPTNSGILTFDQNGNVTINAGKLDRESADHHEFLVIVTDMAADESERREASAILILNVIDENDNPPVISPSNYAITISEYSPLSSSIFDFDATDADVTSVVSYAASDPNAPAWQTFMLNSTNGDITIIGALVPGSEIVKVYATDGKYNSSDATLTVTIESANNSLVFVTDRYHYVIQEDHPVNFVVGIATFTSAALITATASKPTTIKYYIRADSQKMSEDIFQLNETTGDLKLKKSVDFEQERYYAFLVDAVDTTNRFANATALVVVDILDVVDVVPKAYVVCFDQEKNCTHASYNLTEHPAMGEIVAVIYTEDPDTASSESGGKQFRYFVGIYIVKDIAFGTNYFSKKKFLIARFSNTVSYSYNQAIFQFDQRRPDASLNCQFISIT